MTAAPERRVMNKMKQAVRIAAVLAAAGMLAGLTACTGKPGEVPAPAEEISAAPTLIMGDAQHTEPAAIEGMTPVGTKGFVGFSIDTATGDFAVEDLRNGHIWYSTPPDAEEDTVAVGAAKFELRSQLVISIIREGETTTKSRNSANGCKEPGDITVETRENGAVVTYRFSKEGITIPVVYTLMEDGFTAEIRTEDIVETEDSRVMAVSLLPFFGAQDATVSGEMMMPSGNGTRIDFNNGKLAASPYRVQLYGRDIVTSPEQMTNRQENLSLPVFYLEKPGNGFVAFAEVGSANGYVNASVSGQSTEYNQAYFEFETRSIQTAYIGWGTTAISQKKVETTPIATGDIRVRYVLTDEEQEGSAEKAAVVRAWLTEVMGAQPLTADTAPLQLSVLGCMLKTKSVAGITMEAAEKMTGYADALKIVEDLRASGVSRITMRYQGWSKSELYGKIMTTADSLGKLGSDDDLQALASALTENGGHLYLNSMNTVFAQSGNGYSFNSDIIRDINKLQAEQYQYYTAVFFKNYGEDPMRVLTTDRTIRSLLSLSGELGRVFPQVGIALGDTGKLLYSDFSSGGLRRHEALRQLRSGLDAVSEETSLLGDNPNAYVLPYTSEVSNLPAYGTLYDISDGDVPFYSMVLRGLRVAGSTPINQSGDHTQAFLRCVETGMALNYEVIWEASDQRKGADLDSFYAAQYADVGESIKEQYARYAPLYEATAEATITHYEQQGDIVVTTYSNGVKSWVNYGDEVAEADGQTIPARDFVWTEEDAA